MTREETRRAIEDLLADYAHAIDDDRLEEWPSFFTADGTYTIIPRENQAKGQVVGIMNCTSPGMMRDRVLAYRRANIYEPHWYRHLVSALRIVDETAGVYTVWSGYAVIRTMQEGDIAVFSSGKCIDRVVFEAGKARFKERLVICDSARIDTLIVLPI
ncbi:MAG: aromatic-ring-hydroxylating dioxygenase subunit beta [Alphaproteobacteria bacterium]|nr:aromatic-ring-hydroxylating dioxygenase subunit beta [Alphaproteobacteria bacterium]